MLVELKPGDRFLDRFRVDHLAAEGGMASIFVAKDEVTGQNIAIKTLYPYYVDNQIIRSRFLEEGRIQQILRHPNILRVFQVIEEPVLSILMEYVEGPTLDDFLQDNGQLTEMQIIDIIIPVMSAVGFAHSRSIVHRDIKPSNILLHHGNPRNPKILDFGVAKVKRAGQSLTATGTTVGTLHYMSPEQIVGSKNIDGRADVYSLGVTMYKLIAGEVPFNAPTEFALMMAQVEAPPLPPSKIRPGITPEFEAIILRAMEKKPSQRFQTIKEFTTALLNLRLGNLSVEATLTATISSEIIGLAMAADEVAYDRTSESAFTATEPLDDADIELGDDTAAIEATLKIERGPSTEELSNSSVLALREKSRVMDALVDVAEQETDIIPSLRERTSEKSADETQPSIPSQIINQAKLAATRPSRPSAVLPPAAIPQFEDPDTVSLGIVIKNVDLVGGIHVTDEFVDSRDMTAPRVKERDLRAALSAAEAASSADSGESLRRTRPTGKNRAVKDIHAARNPPGIFSGVTPSSDPLEDGRVHLPLETPHSQIGFDDQDDPTTVRPKLNREPVIYQSRPTQGPPARTNLKDVSAQTREENSQDPYRVYRIGVVILIIVAAVVWILVLIAML